MPSALHSRARRAVVAAIAAACAPWPAWAATALGDPKTVAMRLQATGTVSALDAGARQLTLHGPRGDASYGVDPRVKNLGQVQLGDRVTIDYVATLLVTLRRPGKQKPPPPRGEVQVRPSAPGVPVPIGTRVFTTVLSVDYDAQTMMLEGPLGRMADLPVQDQADLVGVRVGDRVETIVQVAVVVGLESASR